MLARIQPARQHYLMPLLMLLAGALSQGLKADGAWVPVYHPDLDALFLAHSAELGAYHSVLIDPLSVWYGMAEPSSGGFDAELGTFRALYTESFAEALERNGYAIARAPGPGVVQLHVEIVDLLVSEHTEDQLAWAQRFRFDAARGHLTLVAELSDSLSGEVLLRIADMGETGGPNEVWITARQSFEAWANSLASLLTTERTAAHSVVTR